MPFFDTHIWNKWKAWIECKAPTQHHRDSWRPLSDPFLQTVHDLSTVTVSCKFREGRGLQGIQRCHTCEDTNGDVHLSVHVHLNEAVLSTQRPPRSACEQQFLCSNAARKNWINVYKCNVLFFAICFALVCLLCVVLFALFSLWVLQGGVGLSWHRSSMHVFLT